MTAPVPTRRTMLGLAAAGVGAGLLPAISAKAEATPLGQAAATAAHRSRVGYGPLVPDPRGLLDLPRGFSYEVLAVAGNSGNPIPATRLTDGGEESPSRYDGTGSFPTRRGGWVLVSNHENSDGVQYPVAMPVPHRSGITYDPGSATGGTTSLTVDRHGRRVSEVVSLAGTISNCAGGVTPRGTWLSCEETEQRAGVRGTTKDHGYVFEVRPHEPTNPLNARPIKAFGRFPHEAVVVDPHRGNVYMTEDAGKPDGLLYKWTPDGPAPRGYAKLADDAGTVWAMRCTDSNGNFVPDLAPANVLGTTYKVSWVKVPDRDARTVSVRSQFTNDQITRSHKLEGMWWGHGGFYFDASFDKRYHDGQIWFFDVARNTIELKTYFPLTADQDGDPDGPDNMTVSPYGGLILCEDGDGANHLVHIDLRGNWAFIARNRQDSEMAGANFSSNGRFLFANSQDPGVVFAIRGPWWSRRSTVD